MKAIIFYFDCYKDSKVVICSPDDYVRAAQVHIDKDEIVDHTVIEPIISMMNRTSKLLVKMFKDPCKAPQSADTFRAEEIQI